MNQLKYYKRQGYEFQIIERIGDLCRAVGRKGTHEIHDVTLQLRGDITRQSAWTFATEKQAAEKFAELTHNQPTT